MRRVCVPARVDVRRRLLAAGLKPTRQRLALGGLLFDQGDRHVFAEELFAEAAAAGVAVSLATVYNLLKDFTRAGLLREVAMPGARCCFDTKTSDHSHFLDPGRGRLLDIAAGKLRIEGLPAAPEGLRISHVDVVVHLVAK